ncbi:MAG: sugar phosphate isomerase/epimerase [Planctomycetaceae bacterium]|nr:sugar phosphate isomerase/epimerase [Planctomycetaceae bacterium]
MNLTRREWLKTSGGIAGAAGLLAYGVPGLWSLNSANAEETPAADPTTQWPIGCFNRPWGRWSYDESLDGMKSAGFRLTGFVGDHKGELFLKPEATAEYLENLKERIESRGLTAIVAWFHTVHDVPLREAIKGSRQQIDNAQHVGLKYLLSGGVGAQAQYENYYKVMADAAAYAQDRSIQIVVKPHGGNVATADDLLKCLAEVNHPNFRIWYDAGNIIHYTGKDPVIEAERLAAKTTGFCAKDCAAEKGDVMLQFGDGKVDFAAVFSKLKQGKFKGPVMVECCGGKTLAEVTAAARANREYLERVFRTV